MIIESEFAVHCHDFILFHKYSLKPCVFKNYSKVPEYLTERRIHVLPSNGVIIDQYVIKAMAVADANFNRPCIISVQRLLDIFQLPWTLGFVRCSTP